MIMTLNSKDISKDLFRPANISDEKSEEITGKSLSFWGDSFSRLSQNKGAMISGIVLLLLIIMSLIGPTFNKYGIDTQNLSASNLPPKIKALSHVNWLPFNGKEYGADQYAERGLKTSYWLGTDELGRDLWTRTWVGTRISIFIGIMAAIIDLVIGVIYGGVSAYFGGRTDNVLQRIVEVLAGIPSLIWIILTILIIQPGLESIIIAMVITGWIGMSRIVRGQILKLKSQEYVLASRTLGAGHTRVIGRQLIPNTLGQIIIQTMFTIPNAIFFEAFLSFIGLGLPSPMASLGVLVNTGYQTMNIHPYQIIYPSIILSLLLICFNILGDGLRDAFDPKLRK